jgi:hypothetical protein
VLIFKLSNIPIKKTTPNIILAKAGLMCLNQQKYTYLTFELTSAVVLQSPAFANILPLFFAFTLH